MKMKITKLMRHYEKWLKVVDAYIKKEESSETTQFCSLRNEKKQTLSPKVVKEITQVRADIKEIEDRKEQEN